MPILFLYFHSSVLYTLGMISVVYNICMLKIYGFSISVVNCKYTFIIDNRQIKIQLHFLKEVDSHNPRICYIFPLK